MLFVARNVSVFYGDFEFLVELCAVFAICAVFSILSTFFSESSGCLIDVPFTLLRTSEPVCLSFDVTFATLLALGRFCLSFDLAFTSSLTSSGFYLLLDVTFTLPFTVTLIVISLFCPKVFNIGVLLLV